MGKFHFILVMVAYGFHLSTCAECTSSSRSGHLSNLDGWAFRNVYENKFPICSTSGGHVAALFIVAIARYAPKKVPLGDDSSSHLASRHGSLWCPDCVAIRPARRVQIGNLFRTRSLTLSEYSMRCALTAPWPSGAPTSKWNSAASTTRKRPKLWSRTGVQLMPGKRNAENKGLPSQWKLVHGAYSYQVAPGLEFLWDDEKTFRLGKTASRTKYAVANPSASNR